LGIGPQEVKRNEKRNDQGTKAGDSGCNRVSTKKYFLLGGRRMNGMTEQEKKEAWEEIGKSMGIKITYVSEESK